MNIFEKNPLIPHVHSEWKKREKSAKKIFPAKITQYHFIASINNLHLDFSAWKLENESKESKKKFNKSQIK
jgi:hypothetical protein